MQAHRNATPIGVNRRGFLTAVGATGIMSAAPDAAADSTDPSSPASSPASSKDARVDPTHEPFTTSSPDLSRQANLFWTVYGVAEGGPEAPGARAGRNSAWLEWLSLQYAWTTYRNFRAEAMDGMLSVRLNGSDGVTGKQPNGFVWSWVNSETWPDDSAGHGGKGSYHFDQIPRFINATYAYYVWTRDQRFLDRALPRARLVMEEYVLPVLEGEHGLWTIPDATNNGMAGHSRPSTYLDQIRSGYQDGWVNATAYTALLAMSKLEQMAGNQKAAKRYGDLAEVFPEHFDKALWNESTGRYAGWRAADGTLHDSGYLHVNLEALGRGLGSEARAARVFELIAAPAAEVRFGPHTGSTDVYQNFVAPRTATEPVPAADWDPWSDPAAGTKPYGDNVQAGGTLLWLNYYDVMARLRYQDADRAYVRFRVMLERMAADAHLLTYDPPRRLYNDFGESLVQLGTSHPFPESGISVLPLVYGFAGVRATTEGLVAAPNLPTDLLHVAVSDLGYGGQQVSVRVTRADVVAESAENALKRDLAPGGSGTDEFEARQPFNRADVQVSATHGGWVDVRLERRSSGAWEPIASRTHKRLENEPRWLDLSFTPQGSGTYRLVTSRPGKDGPLPHPEGEGGGGISLHRYRVLHAPQHRATPASGSGNRVRTRSSVDRFTVDLGRAIEQPVTLRLRRKVGSRWLDVSNQTVEPLGSRQVVIGTCDQQPGTFRVQAMVAGAEIGPVELRTLECAIYTIESPELELRTTTAGGTSVVLAEPPG